MFGRFLRDLFWKFKTKGGLKFKGNLVCKGNKYEINSKVEFWIFLGMWCETQSEVSFKLKWEGY